MDYFYLGIMLYKYVVNSDMFGVFFGLRRSVICSLLHITMHLMLRIDAH